MEELKVFHSFCLRCWYTWHMIPNHIVMCSASSERGHEFLAGVSFHIAGGEISDVGAEIWDTLKAVTSDLDTPSNSLILESAGVIVHGRDLRATYDERGGALSSF